MAEKNYFSTIVLGVIFVGLVFMSSLGTEHSGGWLVLASFFGCGFLAQILVVNGIMQVTPANQVQRVTLEEYRINYRNMPYKSIIAKVNSSGVTVTTVEDAIKTYSSLFNVGEKAAKPFFNNQFVMSSLGLSKHNSAQVSPVSPTRQNNSKKLDANFWENVSEGVAQNQAKSDEICAAGNCSKPVSAFDFRCFKCRSRFCSECESGKGIMCQSCS
jgi:hypothetical protein